MANQPNSLQPILCAHLLRQVDEKLIDLLSALTPSEWELQTVAPQWKVPDVTAHLLDNHGPAVTSKPERPCPQELAWRLFTKGINRSSARAQLEIDGDRDLAEKILDLTAIVG